VVTKGGERAMFVAMTRTLHPEFRSSPGAQGGANRLEKGARAVATAESSRCRLQRAAQGTLGARSEGRRGAHQKAVKRNRCRSKTMRRPWRPESMVRASSDTVSPSLAKVVEYDGRIQAKIVPSSSLSSPCTVGAKRRLNATCRLGGRRGTQARPGPRWASAHQQPCDLRPNRRLAPRGRLRHP
jgi:hypothetical protein